MMNPFIVRRLAPILMNDLMSNGKSSKKVLLFTIRRLSMRTSCKIPQYCQSNDRMCLFLTRYARVQPRRWNHSDSNEVLFNLADIGEGITEVVIKEWFIKEGDIVKEFDPICEVQSDKASVTITSRYNGKIRKLLYNVDDVAKVGKPLISISTEFSESTPGVDGESQDLVKIGFSNILNRTTQTNELPSRSDTTSLIVPTLPSVRRMAKDHGIDLSKVSPTGRNRRVLKDDLINYLNGVKKQSTTAVSVNPNQKDENNHTTRQVKFNAITKAMFSRMSDSLKIPHFYYSEEIDMTTLVTSMKDQRCSDTKNHVKINALAYMVKSCSMALVAYPILNGSIGYDKEHIVVKEYHNIGVAMDTADGLVLPNIKNVERLSIIEVATEIERLKNLSRTGNLSVSDITDGTFSLSNIGSIGGIFGCPVISAPELAIGAIGKIKRLPRYESSASNQIVARDIMQVVWAADHRVIDGATVARFSNLMKEYLENPSIMASRLR